MAGCSSCHPVLVLMGYSWWILSLKLPFNCSYQTIRKFTVSSGLLEVIEREGITERRTRSRWRGRGRQTKSNEEWFRVTDYVCLQPRCLTRLIATIFILLTSTFRARYSGVDLAGPLDMRWPKKPTLYIPCFFWCQCSVIRGCNTPHLLRTCLTPCMFFLGKGKLYLFQAQYIKVIHRLEIFPTSA